ncbi:MAG: HAMP domain-containing histidine kinase [Rhodoluna sp.]|nr:HAMP domain-containing histidine kinase [Rhodoluna sp.]
MNEKLAALNDRISLRTKLTVMSVGLIGLLLVVSSFGTISLLRTYLQQNTDSLLTSTAASLADEDPLLLEARLATRQVTIPRLPSDYYIAFLDSRGSLLIGLVSSANAKNAVPNLNAFTLEAVMATEGRPFDIDVSSKSGFRDLGNWRMVATPLTTVKGSLVIALPDMTNARLLAQYRAIGTGFGFILLTLSGLAIWLTITSALRPLREVERTAAMVAAGDTSQRLVAADETTEIGRLNGSLNSMLDSIDSAMSSRNRALDQMKRFVADASHELRTPLVTLRGYAELYRIGALKKKADIDEAMASIESESIRMSELVENLLALARMDETNPLAKESNNIAEIAELSIRDAGASGSKHKIVLVALDSKPLPEDFAQNAEVDASGLRQVFTNLIVNATKFSNENDQIEIALGAKDGRAVIEVRDHGDGIPKALREKVFERFYRADNSRNRETGGSGLGLSIVKTIVTRHGGDIKALETPGGGATFKITLPLK